MTTCYAYRVETGSHFVPGLPHAVAHFSQAAGSFFNWDPTLPKEALSRHLEAHAARLADRGIEVCPKGCLCNYTASCGRNYTASSTTDTDRVQADAEDPATPSLEFGEPLPVANSSVGHAWFPQYFFGLSEVDGNGTVIVRHFVSWTPARFGGNPLGMFGSHAHCGAAMLFSLQRLVECMASKGVTAGVHTISMSSGGQYPTSRRWMPERGWLQRHVPRQLQSSMPANSCCGVA